MKNFAFYVLLGLACVCKASAQQAEIFGEGQSSCATWLTAPENQNSGEEWILGFWKGMNVSHSLMTGSNTDADGIVGEVEKECGENPSELLLFATSKVW